MTNADDLIDLATRKSFEAPPCAAASEMLFAETPAHAGAVEGLAWLQSSLMLCQQMQEAVTRVLAWHRTLAQPEKELPLDVKVSLTDGLSVQVSHPIGAPLLCDQKALPLNTAFHLRDGEFVRHTCASDSWALRQVQFQTCGVLSRSLGHFVEVLATLAPVRTQKWAVYIRVGNDLALTESLPFHRGGLWLRDVLALRRRQALAIAEELDRATGQSSAEHLARDHSISSAHWRDGLPKLPSKKRDQVASMVRGWELAQESYETARTAMHAWRKRASSTLPL